MPHQIYGMRRFRKSWLALAAGAAIAPIGARALDLSQSPPGTTEPYVAPNVIISLDDSGSMDYRIDRESSSGATNNTTPNADGTWPGTSRRINILKSALSSVFNDRTLLPEGKIRLAWQAMWNNGGSSGAASVDSGTMQQNSMRPLTDAHRTNFLNFVAALRASGGTPTHRMMSQADAYMRRALSINSPWAADPGNTALPYLGCRRNYHIVMTDGRWNQAVTGSNWDGTARTLPDSTPYNGGVASARLYWDATATTTLADWAFYSWAVPLQSAGLTGAVKVPKDYSSAPATENFGLDVASKPAILPKYWNPRYDPATWPHMVTYTIGLSANAYTWATPAIVAPGASDRVPYSYDAGHNGSLPSLITGQVAWPGLFTSPETNNSLDLWHAALNGRGRFYAVSRGEDLEAAFRQIIGTINSQNEANTSSSATSGGNTSRTAIGRFRAEYDPTQQWKGDVVSETVDSSGDAVANPDWSGKTTAQKLDELASSNDRVILTWNDTWTGATYKTNSGQGSAFHWSGLAATQQAWLQLNPDTLISDGNGALRLEYVRGDRSHEGTPFRTRSSRQGDIVNSAIWYTGAPSSNYSLKGYSQFSSTYKTRTPMLYVGGNDGMLHGFSAADGSEKIAYVPRGVLPTLGKLTAESFNDNHRYYVDGSPMTGDVDLANPGQVDAFYNTSSHTPSWATVLVGTLGGGGKGYFALNVTNPSSSSFAEANANSLVLLDRSRGSSEAAPNCTVLSGAEKVACDRTVEEDKDIGHITAAPVVDESNAARTTQITRMNNNRWAVVLGNGYNSTNQRPVLLVQYLDGQRELLRIPAAGTVASPPTPGTGLAKDNGLAAPRVVDINGDSRADIVYAGDNQGNLWKFDLTSDSDADWAAEKFAGGVATPLFTARGPATYGGTSRTIVQPISVAPTTRANDRTMSVLDGHGTPVTVAVGGMMVSFGTGRNVDEADSTNTNVQTLYSVLDRSRYKKRAAASLGQRLQVHPGGGSCPSGDDCVPAPAAIGTMGVDDVKLAQQKVSGGVIDVVDALDAATWSDKNGWYLDLPELGERLLKAMEFYDGSNLLSVYTQIPAKGSNASSNTESCENTSVEKERQFRTFINIMDGKRPSVQLVDANSDGLFSSADGNVSRTEVSRGAHDQITSGSNVIDMDTRGNKEKLARLPEKSLRPNWRQLQ